MRYLSEFRDPAAARALASGIRKSVTRPWTIMEICGGQTHTIVRTGLAEMLPPELRLVHGPGCPVCVTPLETVDRAVAIASTPGVIFLSFGDMLRVPGSSQDLLSVKAAGGDVRVVYSPLDAVRAAQANPGREVVFFAVGFETTAPATAMALREARRLALRNFTMLVSHVLVPPAMRAILSSPGNRVQGFLAAGHVCTVTGYEEYEPLAAEFRTPVVVTGFEPLDILQGILMVVRLLEEGRWEVGNQYTRCVLRSGNRSALDVMTAVFTRCDRAWRGIGVIPGSGLALRPGFSAYDAEQRFGVHAVTAEESAECRAGSVLQGVIRPDECPAFRTRCTPERPLGAPMVSSEGACAAYHRYRGTPVHPAGQNT